MTLRIRRISRRRTWLAAGVALAALTALGCGGSSSKSTQQADTVDTYMKSLPRWEEFSPVQADLDPYVAGTPGDTIPTRVGTKDYVCQTTPYAIQRTPEELVMYSPNIEILWPGALLEGSSYKSGDGSGDGALRGLTIKERTPIQVSIPALKTADNFREVVPNLGTVNQAIGAMIGNATEADLRTPSSVNFKMDAFHSEQQFALSIGVSGRYMGFSAKADFSYDQNAEETTVVVHFTEKMYEVVVPPPQTPRAFFSPEFTQARLDEQIALGKIGEDNLPIYVSNVVYGRMFTFAMTSTQTESAIRAALQAAYSFGVGSVSTDISSQQRELIQQSKIAIATVGGDPENVLSVIRSGDWRDYFNRRPKLSAATPLSYTFRTLTGEIALVTETATYGATVCEPALTGFLPVQAVNIALPPPFNAATGDLNGDGRADLVWNHRGATNDVKVGFGRLDGTFDVSAPVVQITGSPAGGWTDFVLQVADMDGDGLDDLVWNRIASGKSETYVALSRSDGTFDPTSLTTRAEAVVWASPLKVSTALVLSRVESTPPHDLLWSRITASENVVAATVFGGAIPVDLTPQTLTAPAGGWGAYSGFGAMLGDLTGDGADDLVFGARGKVCTAVNDGAGVFAVKPVFSAGMAKDGYEAPLEDGFRVADVNGDGKADVLRFDRRYQREHTCTFWLFGCWTYRDTFNAETEVLTSNGTGLFAAAAMQSGWGVWDPAIDPYLRDVSGDGKADLVWITLAAEAKVSVALAGTNASGAFTAFTAGIDHKPKTALPPGASNWNAFRAYLADVNGDGRTDIVLNDNNAVGSIYVDLR